MKKVILLIALFLVSCAPAKVVPPTVTVIAVADAVKTIVVDAAKTQTATAPTNTPQPTKTPIPTATSTPLPQPIILKGSGDSVIDVDKWVGAALLKVTHTGGGNFAVINYAGNKKVDLLVNTIGNYSGTRVLDFRDPFHTTRFVITAGGQWELQILSIDTIRFENIPGTITGDGDDVLAIRGKPDLLKSTYPGDSNFAIIGWGKSKDLLVNEIGPYSGTTIIPDGIFILEIIATGPWSLEITGK